MNIGYLILAHHKLEQVHTLISQLHTGQDHFFVHLDRKCKEKLTPDRDHQLFVHFTEKRHKVHWGGYSIVKATLQLLREAINTGHGFDYYILLSGVCFPIKSTGHIKRFLVSNQGKLFIETQLLNDVTANEMIDRINYPAFFDQLGWMPERLPFFRHMEYKKWLIGKVKQVYKRLNMKRKRPGYVNPHFGSQWWALPHDAVSHILDYSNDHPELLKFFKYTWAPDELLIQTILGNSPFRDRITNENLHYIDWDTNGPPKTLSREDIPLFHKSRKLFARKFDGSFDIVTHMLDKLNE